MIINKLSKLVFFGCDIFNNLKMGFMLNFEATNGTWAVGSDVLYMSLTEKVASKNEIIGGEITAKQLGWEISGLYRVTPWLELGLGALVNSLNAGLDLSRKEIGGETKAFTEFSLLFTT